MRACGAALMVCSAAWAQPLYQQTSALYDIDVTFNAGLFEDGSSAIGPEEILLEATDFRGGSAVFLRATPELDPDLFRLTVDTGSISTFQFGLISSSTVSIEIGLDVLEDSSVTLETFNQGWVASIKADAMSSLTVEIEGPGGVVLQESAPRFDAFFSRTFNLPAGSYTWRVDSTSSTRDAALVGLDQTTSFANADADFELRFERGFGPCNGADLADPREMLDQADIDAFVAGFFAGDEDVAGLREPAGLASYADVVAFVELYLAGCGSGS